MNNKLENNIKNQLENREILVSENAWEKLRDMMDEKPVERKIKPWFWMGIAASVVLVVGLFFGLNFHEPKANPLVGNPSEILVQETNNHSDERNSNETEKSQNSPENLIPETKIYTQENLNSTEFVKSVPKDSPVEMSSEHPILEEIIKEYTEPKVELKEEPVMALNTDSISKPTNKTNYVDPEMLLYSVENNQAVQQKNSGSRMVLINFNK